jgi:transposase
VKQEKFAGIDVSARELVVAVWREGKVEQLRFGNDRKGHRQLVKALLKGGGVVKVGLESTGVYGLELALWLDRTRGVEVMVANPRAVKDFGDALLKRTKTDLEDAVVILEFVRRMPFERWHAPSESALAVRTLARRIAAMVETRTAEKNRLHAAQYAGDVGRVIRKDIEEGLKQLEKRIERLTAAAITAIRSDGELQRKYQLLVSATGIAKRSAVRLLGELEVLASDMTPRQWVAHAGLDPRHHQSGTSINKPARLSKVGNQRLRAALFMPALVAIQHEPRIREYVEALERRGKKRLQAIAAVMRRLLHSIHAMFRLNVPFDPEKFARPIDFRESA